MVHDNDITDLKGTGAGHKPRKSFMVIPPDLLLKSVPKHLRFNLHPGSAVDRVQRFFCPAMQRLGDCTGICSSCVLEIVNIFADFCNFKDPRDPYACLVYCIREYTSKLADKQEAAQIAQPRTNWLGERLDENPFDLALEEL